MKLLNIFKKGTTKIANPKTQSLDKSQLEKVIGGGGSDVPLNTNAAGTRGAADFIITQGLK